MRKNQIAYFGYVRIFPNHSFISLVTDTAWSEYHYIEKALPPAGLLNFDSIENQQIILLNECSDTLIGWPHGTVAELNARFNILNTLFITKKYSHFIECFGFTTTNNNPAGFFLNNFGFLESFYNYIKDKAADIIKKATSAPLYYQKHSAKLSTQPELIAPIETKHYILYADSTSVRITRREYQVLSFLAHGLRVKQIATELEISPRTIEVYYLNLREKFNTNDINQLTKLFWQNKLFTPDTPIA